MKTITELTKERLLIRKTDERRYKVLTLLIDGATKIAKSENRDVEEKDIFKTASSSVKEIEKDVQLLTEKQQGTYIYLSELLLELEIWKEFLPKLLSEGEIKRIILQKYSEDFLVKANLSQIMKDMKSIKDIDMSIVSRLLKEYLK